MGDSLVQDFLVDPSRCNEPTLDTLQIDVRGHYSTGFEESQLVPCPGELKRAWPDRVFDSPRIWVKWTDIAWANIPKKWPPADTTGYGDRYYVAWRGLLYGPGDYGHLSVFNYEFTVTNLVAVRTPRSSDCR